MAELIRRLPDDVVASFALANAEERVAQLKNITNRIAIDTLPFVGWIERHRHPGTADQVKRRLLVVLDEAVECVVYDIPEYAGGTIQECATHGEERPPSNGAKRTATLGVTAMLVADMFLNWADDIEAEDMPHDSSSGMAAKTPTKSITNLEADAVARRLDEKDVTFRHLTAKEMAARIQNESDKSCSDSLVKQLPFWGEAMTSTGRGRKRGGAKGQGQKRGTVARPMNFSKNLEAVTGVGKEHEVLEELVEEEEAAKAKQAMQEQAQAIALVNRSRLTPKAKAETIAKLEDGTMTAQQALDMVSLLQQDPVSNKKKHPS